MSKQYYSNEKIYPDGVVKHIYNIPLPLADVDIEGLIEDFLNNLNLKPKVLILRDTLADQCITVNCTKTTDIPSIITNFLSEENSGLHYLYSYPATADGDVIMAGLEFNNQIYNPLKEHRASGSKLIEIKAN
jgi:hypothetical protein